MNPAAAIRHDLVLVGGGHTHIQVFRARAMDPAPGAQFTVVVDRPVAVYSGMGRASWRVSIARTSSRLT
jgi:selenide,water dikinase